MEIVADRGIAVATPCEDSRSVLRDTPVVQDTDPRQRLERLVTGCGGDSALQPLGKRTLGQVTHPQRPPGDLERLGPSQFPPYEPERGPVEREADAQTRANDDLGRQYAPGRAVELHHDAAAARSEGGNRPSRLRHEGLAAVLRSGCYLC